MDLKWFCSLRKHILEHHKTTKFTAARAVLFDKRFQKIQLVPYKGFMTHNDVRLDGLTSQLTKVFHPVPLSFATGGAKSGGSARGNIVDNELKCLVNDGYVNGSLHPYTLKTLHFLLSNGLQPFAAQVAVGDIDLKLATTLDLLCVDLKLDNSNNVVNVQLKTGFDHQYERVGGKMLSPFFSDPILMNMDDSYFNRHKLQNLIEHWIIQQNYGFPLHRSEVLVISENWVRNDVLEVDPALATSIINELQNRNSVSEVELAVKQLRKRYAIKYALQKKRGKR